MQVWQLSAVGVQPMSQCAVPGRWQRRAEERGSGAGRLNFHLLNPPTLASRIHCHLVTLLRRAPHQQLLPGAQGWVRVLGLYLSSPAPPSHLGSSPWLALPIGLSCPHILVLDPVS